MKLREALPNLFNLVRITNINLTFLVGYMMRLSPRTRTGRHSSSYSSRLWTTRSAACSWSITSLTRLAPSSEWYSERRRSSFRSRRLLISLMPLPVREMTLTLNDHLCRSSSRATAYGSEMRRPSAKLSQPLTSSTRRTCA